VVVVSGGRVEREDGGAWVPFVHVVAEGPAGAARGAADVVDDAQPEERVGVLVEGDAGGGVEALRELDGLLEEPSEVVVDVVGRDPRVGAGGVGAEGSAAELLDVAPVNLVAVELSLTYQRILYGR